MVEYKKGMENQVANALSRRSDGVFELGQQCSSQKSSCLFLLSVPDPTWLTTLKESYIQDQSLQQLIQSIQSSTTPKGFTWQNNLIFYKGRFFLGPGCPLISQVLHHVHNSPVAGHSGFLKTYQRVKMEFYWQGMKFAIKQFIRECDVCQQVKSKTSVPTGLLQPLDYYSLD